MINRRTFVALASAAVMTTAIAFAEAPKGRIETLGKLGPRNDGEPRVRIWLPPGYEDSGRSYRTLYMLDGQFVFSSDSDGENFGADSRIERLAAAGIIQPALIVAIYKLEEHRFLK